MRIILIILLTNLSCYCIAQDTNLCGWTTYQCHLPKNHEAHFDPYYNGHLCENFNPRQIDFSQEYLKLQINSISKVATEVTSKITDYSLDLDSLFNTNQTQQNGVIGTQNNRIRIHISETKQDKNDDLTFLIYGVSNVNGNICNFSGKIKILNAFETLENYEFNGQGELFAQYELFEDSTQNHSGFFKGTFECAIQIDHSNKTLKLDESFAIADGYYNRSYVGTWTDYKTHKIKKCIWGDYRLPFTFDFDCGDGEMHICEKYAKNGWESFNESNEYQFVDGSSKLKTKWWIKK
jgi:hypothetical protein